MHFNFIVQGVPGIHTTLEVHDMIRGGITSGKRFVGS